MRHERTIRISAAVVVAGAVLSAPVAVLVVGVVAPQPDWQTATVFLQYYHPVQTLPYVFGFLLLAGFLSFLAACHAGVTRAMRFRTSVALVCGAIYGSLVFLNYTLQVAFVPRTLALDPDVAGALTMANPASVAWFLEMYGYAALGVGTWLVSRAFGGSARGRLIRHLLVANGVMSVIGAASIALVDRWVFSTAGLVSFAAWNILIPSCYLLIALSPDAGLDTRSEDTAIHPPPSELAVATAAGR